ncbi:MAG: phosphoribosylanthranilate isomerase [Paludibacter sp.]|jgi:phosphoribosylanthranilate isomerase|nr:phosphoribosylanthranilate isomerase [Paludibacter sp.]
MDRALKIKICGMRDADNIMKISALKPNYLGFVFYPKSPRYAANVNPEVLRKIPSDIKKIGVFVNESLKNILTIAYKFNLDGVQLHGAENIEICKELKNTGLTVIKAFSIFDKSNFLPTKKYEEVCDFFLFDTKVSDAYGGSGVKFDWSLLNEYKGQTPFFLSGGISPDDAEAILQIKHPQFFGIDINSKFETRAGEKNAELLKEFLDKL